MARNTGYKIITYIDVNPQSPTYNTTRSERVLDTSRCSLNDADYQLVETYCELDGSGVNSGYLISLYQDMNPKSSTYGSTREDRTYDASTCPLPSRTAEWVEDPDFPSYCELIWYEPSHTEGNSGKKVSRWIDDNPLSPTYNTAEVRAEDSEDCPAPSTDPQLEVVTENCEICSANGVLSYSGFKNVVGIDKNVYSPTFMETSEERVEDTRNCPASYSYDFDLDANSYYASSSSDNVTVYVDSSKYNPCAGSLDVDWETSESCSWVSIREFGDRFRVDYDANYGDSRQCTITVIQSESRNREYFTLYQEAAPMDYVFTIAQPSGSYAASGETKSVAVTSTLNGDNIGFTASESCSWVSVTTASTSISVTVTPNTDESNSRTCTITLTQDGSDDTLTYTLTQAAASSDYVFTLATTTDIVAAIPRSYTYGITSTKNGNNIGYSFSESCSWLSISTGATSFTATVTENTSTTTSRNCTVNFTQNESENTERFVITQNASSQTVYIFTISQSSDSVGWGSTSNTYSVTSTKDGSRIGFTASESCSWLSVTTSSTGVSVSVTENTGNSRTCVITLTQSESGYFLQLTIIQDAKPQTCTINGISASLTYLPMTASAASTLVTISSSGSICSNDWEAYKMYRNSSGNWVIMPSSKITGHNNTNLTVHSPGRYRIFSTDDSSYYVDIVAHTVYGLCVSGNTTSPNAWEIEGRSSQSAQICDNDSPMEFGIVCTATTSDEGHMSRTCYYSFTNASISSIGYWKITDGSTTATGSSASLGTAIRCNTDCYATFTSSSATLENNTTDRWMIDATLILSSGDEIEFRGTLYGTPMGG